MRWLLSLAITLVAVLAVIPLLSMIAEHAGRSYVDGVRKRQGIASPEEKAAARVVAAKTKFVPAAQRQFPRLTAGVPADRLAKIATGTCDLFENFPYTKNYKERARALVRTTLTHDRVKPTSAQVNTVIRLAGTTTCPNKGYLSNQFR